MNNSQKRLYQILFSSWINKSLALRHFLMERKKDKKESDARIEQHIDEYIRLSAKREKSKDEDNRRKKIERLIIGPKIPRNDNAFREAFKSLEAAGFIDKDESGTWVVYRSNIKPFWDVCRGLKNYENEPMPETKEYNEFKKYVEAISNSSLRRVIDPSDVVRSIAQLLVELERIHDEQIIEMDWLEDKAPLLFKHKEYSDSNLDEIVKSLESEWLRVYSEEPTNEAKKKFPHKLLKLRGIVGVLHASVCSKKHGHCIGILKDDLRTCAHLGSFANGIWAIAPEEERRAHSLHGFISTLRILKSEESPLL